jgi:hypothetical protein
MTIIDPPDPAGEPLFQCRIAVPANVYEVMLTLDALLIWLDQLVVALKDRDNRQQPSSHEARAMGATMATMLLRDGYQPPQEQAEDWAQFLFHELPVVGHRLVADKEGAGIVCEACGKAAGRVTADSSAELSDPESLKRGPMLCDECREARKQTH